MARTRIPKQTLDRITPSLVSEWRDERKRFVKNNTVRREMTLLSSVFSYASSVWHLPITDPVEGPHCPSQSAGRDPRPFWSELRMVLRELSSRLRGGCSPL